jgi:mannitol-specific phosphotransferase system IIBC component
MDGQTLRNLQEAYYSEVHQVDEAITSERGKAKAKEMIASRSTASGRAKSGQGDTVSQIKHISRSDKEGLGGTPMTPTMAKNPVKKRTMTGVGTGNKATRRAAALKKEQVDIYDIIFSHLLDEGYAETPEAAEAIMVNMSEEWIDSIVDEVITEGEKPFPYDKVTAQGKKHSAAGRHGNVIKMGLAKRRAKEAEKTGGSQQDAGKGWYHGK